MKGKFAGGTYVNPERLTSSIVLVDPATGEQKARKDLPYPNSAGVLTTAGGIVVTALLDGTIVALDDQTLEELWKINVGTGFNAPPMTYSVDGKQYIAIASGLWRQRQEQVAPLAGDADCLAGDDDLGVRAVEQTRVGIRAGLTLHSGGASFATLRNDGGSCCLRGTALNSNARYLRLHGARITSSARNARGFRTGLRSPGRCGGRTRLWPFFRR